MSSPDVRMTDIAWSSNGILLASTNLEDTVQLWDAATGEQLVTLVGHTVSVNQVVWSPDGTLLASTGEGGTIGLWGLPD